MGVIRFCCQRRGSWSGVASQSSAPETCFGKSADGYPIARGGRGYTVYLICFKIMLIMVRRHWSIYAKFNLHISKFTCIDFKYDANMHFLISCSIPSYKQLLTSLLYGNRILSARYVDYLGMSLACVCKYLAHVSGVIPASASDDTGFLTPISGTLQRRWGDGDNEQHWSKIGVVSLYMRWKKECENISLSWKVIMGQTEGGNKSCILIVDGRHGVDFMTNPRFLFHQMIKSPTPMLMTNNTFQIVKITREMK